MHSPSFPLSLSVHAPEVVPFNPLSNASVLFVSGLRTAPNDPYGRIADVRDGIHAYVTDEQAAAESARRAENIRREEESAVSSLRASAESEGPDVLMAFQADFRGALAARLHLVKGVITGQTALVDKALAEFADPNTLVLAQDPTNATQMIPMPIGLVALLRGHEAARIDGPEKAAPWMAMAQKLLMGPHGCRIKLGVDPAHPNAATSAISWSTFGFDPSGNDSIESRMIPGISAALFGTIAKVVPAAVVDGPVSATTDGWVPGERSPARSSIGLAYLAGREFALGAVKFLAEYRARRTGEALEPVDPSEATPRRPGLR